MVAITNLKIFIMKKMYLIFLFIPFISCCQSDSEFIFQNSFPVKWDEDNICISKEDCFLFTNIPNDYKMIIFYSNEKYNKKQLIDTLYWADFPYKSTLNIYKSEKYDSYIVLWKNDYEHSPIFDVYYIKYGKLIQIGCWIINTPYPINEITDFLDYSVKNIRIRQKRNTVEFSFSKDMAFIDYSKEKNDNWGSFKAGELILSFNTVDGTVKRVEKRE